MRRSISNRKASAQHSPYEYRHITIMTDEKRISLDTTYRQLLDQVFYMDDIESIEPILDAEFTCYGTAFDEKLQGFTQMRDMLMRQKQQSVGFHFDCTTDPMKHFVSEDGNTAVFSDDIYLHIRSTSETIEVYVRATSVFLHRPDGWKIVSWHVSKPENVSSQDDTYGIDDWKKRNADLEILVAKRTADLVEKNRELENALEQLKATQTQLVQSEKMASLGELTAGIAHEIQNPLNFVNNFSDVSIELLDEMDAEIEKGDTDEAKAISSDIKQNLEKIAYHGRRADSIVKGMLQHSRASTGQKELTDINVLVDEYLRLAYHGLRATDQSFNAELITHFDENLPKANILPQDIGRVLLNLFTNAFYATQQRAKSKEQEYYPTVEVLTRIQGDSIEIFVKDNGIGIPDEIREKVLQPFFTTKPTGEGTGLGLSLSYDIVVKAHGGTIRIDSKEGEFTLFSVLLPIT
ncbi:MAG: GHKL domain-containing protein [Flavobacterium sp.]|nr:MAG: GHKL domain-containing protein [Flavobacterium sp.]